MPAPCECDPHLGSLKQTSKEGIAAFPKSYAQLVRTRDCYGNHTLSVRGANPTFAAYLGPRIYVTMLVLIPRCKSIFSGEFDLRREAVSLRCP
jgi:hypothetical protein